MRYNFEVANIQVMDGSFQIISKTNCRHVECLLCASMVLHALHLLTHSCPEQLYTVSIILVLQKKPSVER